MKYERIFFKSGYYWLENYWTHVVYQMMIKNHCTNDDTFLLKPREKEKNKKPVLESEFPPLPLHSGLFSKYLFHPETFRAQRVAWKTDKTLVIFSVFFNKIDILSYKAVNFVEKYVNFIKVLSVF